MFRAAPVQPGDRVVVRRQAGGHLTDVIGHVEALDPLVVRPQKVGGLPSAAPTVTIPAADIKVVRRLSPRRIRNSDIRAVETATAHAFPGRVRSLAGGWLARSGADIAERSNSATPIGHAAGFQPVPVEELSSFYRERGQPLQLLIPERIGAPALKLVESAPAEWTLGPEILVMTRGLPDDSYPLPSGGAESPGGIVPETAKGNNASVSPTFQIADQPDADWLSMYHYRGKPLPPDALRDVAGDIDGKLGFGRLFSTTGETIAVTRGTITASADGRIWLGYSAVEVAPQWRRAGLGTRLGQEMLQWGAAQGATDAYLQVLASNDAGIALYTKLGFVEHHRHRYAKQVTG